MCVTALPPTFQQGANIMAAARGAKGIERTGTKDVIWLSRKCSVQSRLTMKRNRKTAKTARRTTRLMNELREIQSYVAPKVKEKGVRAEKNVVQLVRQERIRKARGKLRWEGNLDLSRSDK